MSLFLPAQCLLLISICLFLLNYCWFTKKIKIKYLTVLASFLKVFFSLGHISQHVGSWVPPTRDQTQSPSNVSIECPNTLDCQGSRKNNFFHLALGYHNPDSLPTSLTMFQSLSLNLIYLSNIWKAGGSVFNFFHLYSLSELIQTSDHPSRDLPIAIW